MEKYRKVTKIPSFPYGSLVDQTHMVYVQNVYFPNKIIAVIRISDKYLQLDYDEQTDDLYIRHEIFPFDLPDGFLTFVDHEHPLDVTYRDYHTFCNAQLDGFYCYKFDKLNLTQINMGKVYKYDKKFIRLEAVHSMYLVAVTYFDARTTIISFFANDHPFRVTISDRTKFFNELKSDVQFNVERDKNVDNLDYNFFKCNIDQMERRKSGRHKERIDRSTGILSLLHWIMIALLIASIVLGVCLYAVIKKGPKRTESSTRFVFNTIVSSLASAGKKPIFFYKNFIHSQMGRFKKEKKHKTTKNQKLKREKLYAESRRTKTPPKGKTDQTYLSSFSTETIKTVSTIKSDLSSKQLSSKKADSRKVIKLKKNLNNKLNSLSATVPQKVKNNDHHNK